MNNKLDHMHLMRLFIAIVQQGSFTKGAKNIGITATKASKDIQHLEQSLQVNLLQRTTRSLHLTDSGKQFYTNAVDIVEAHQQMLDNLQSMRHALRGELRISAPSLWGKHILTAIILQFKQSHSEVSFIVNYTNQKMDLHLENLHINFRSTELTDEPYLARFVDDDNYTLCATDQYLNQHCAVKTPDDLDQHQLICLAQRDSLFEKITFTKNSVQQHKHLKGELAFNDKESIYQAVKQHFGIAVLPSYLVKKDIQRGELCQVLPDYPIKSSKFYALYSQRRRESALINHFIDFVVEQLAKDEELQATSYKLQVSF